MHSLSSRSAVQRVFKCEALDVNKNVWGFSDYENDIKDN